MSAVFDIRDEHFNAVLGTRRGAARDHQPPPQRDWLEVRAHDGTVIYAVIEDEAIRFEHPSGRRVAAGGAPAGWQVAGAKTPEGRARYSEHSGIGEGLRLQAPEVERVCAWADAQRPGAVMNPGEVVLTENAARAPHAQERIQCECLDYGNDGSRVVLFGRAVIWRDTRDDFAFGYHLDDEQGALKRYRQLAAAASRYRR